MTTVAPPYVPVLRAPAPPPRPRPRVREPGALAGAGAGAGTGAVLVVLPGATCTSGGHVTSPQSALDQR